MTRFMLQMVGLLLGGFIRWEMERNEGNKALT